MLPSPFTLVLGQKQLASGIRYKLGALLSSVASNWDFTEKRVSRLLQATHSSWMVSNNVLQGTLGSAKDRTL